MAFDMLTRADRINRRTLPVVTDTGKFQTGRWCSVDANGNAAAANASSQNNYLIILGNEVRPDSIGSSSITVAYGQNLFMLDTYGLAVTTTAGMALTPNADGDLVQCNTTGLAVAFAENVKGQGQSGLKIKTLV